MSAGKDIADFLVATGVIKRPQEEQPEQNVNSDAILSEIERAETQSPDVDPELIQPSFTDADLDPAVAAAMQQVQPPAAPPGVVPTGQDIPRPTAEQQLGLPQGVLGAPAAPSPLGGPEVLGGVEPAPQPVTGQPETPVETEVTQQQVIRDPFVDPTSQGLIEQGIELGTEAVASALNANMAKDQLTAEFQGQTAQLLEEGATELETDDERVQFWQNAQEKVAQADELLSRIASNPIDRTRALGGPGGKALAAASILIGGIFIPHTGRNPGLDSLNSVLQQDLQAQIAEHNRLKDGVNLAENQYAQYLKLYQNRGAAIKATFAAKQAAAAAHMEQQILQSAMPEQRKAEALEQVRAISQQALAQHLDAKKLGLQEFSTRAKVSALNAKQRKGTGAGKFVRTFQKGGFNLQKTGSVIETSLDNLKSRFPDVTPEQIQAMGGTIQNGKVSFQSLPEELFVGSSAEKGEAREEVANARVAFQALDDVARIINMSDQEWLEFPVEERTSLLRQLRAQVTAIQALGLPKLSDIDLQQFVDALGVNRRDAIVRFRDKGIQLKNINAGKSFLKRKLQSRFDVALPPGFTFVAQPGKAEDESSAAVAGFGLEATPQQPPLQDSLNKVEQVDPSKPDNNQLTDALSEIEAQVSERPDLFNPEGIINRPEIGGKKGIERKLTKLQKLAKESGDKSLLRRANSLKRKVRDLFKGKEPERRPSGIDRAALRADPLAGGRN